MSKCVYCGAESMLYVADEPTCVACSERIAAGETQPNEICPKCLLSLKRLHDATIKLNDVVDTLAGLIANHRETPPAFREYMETIRLEHQQAADELERHRAGHFPSGKGSAATV